MDRSLGTYMEAFLDPQNDRKRRENNNWMCEGGDSGHPKTTYKKAKILPPFILF
jgi:hypothetical protein